MRTILKLTLLRLKKGFIFSREARKCAREDKAYLRFMRRK